MAHFQPPQRGGGRPIQETRLIERERELALAQLRVKQACASDGGVLVIEGPLGIGKSALLSAVREQARRARMTVLSARGGEIERDLAWGVVRELFVPPLSDAGAELRAELFQGVVATAAAVLGEPVSGMSADPATGQDAMGVVLHGLYWLLVRLTRARGPLLVAIDDVHWSDEPSLRLLGFSAARLGGLPLLLAATVRRGDSGADRAIGALSKGETRRDVIQPAPLSSAGCGQLVEGIFGAEVEEAFQEACLAATGGNPLLVRELARRLHADGVAPRRDLRARLDRFDAPAVARNVLIRIGQLPEAARAVAVGASVMGENARFGTVAALMELTAEDAGRGADALAFAGIVHSDRRLRFEHPIVRTAVYEDVPLHHRSVLHLRAAHLLAETREEPMSVATHLLSVDATGDQWVIEVLKAGAATAMDRGAPESAVVLLRRALEEHSDPAVEAELLHLLGVAEFAATLHEQSFVSLQRAVELQREPLRRAIVALELAHRHALLFTGRGTTTLDDAMTTFEAGTPEATLVQVHRHALSISQLHRYWDSARELELISKGPAGRSDPVVLASTSFALMLRGESLEQAVDLAEAAFRAGLLELQMPNFLGFAASTLAIADHLEQTGMLWDRFIASAQERGSPSGFGLGSAMRSDVHYRLGQVAEAEADARAAVAVFAETSIPFPFAYSYLASALIERDLPDEALAVLAELSLPHDRPMIISVLAVKATAARARLAAGDAQLALSTLRPMEQDPIRQILNPAAISWRSTAALACHALGEGDAAQRLAGEELDRARRWGAARGIGAALRLTGMVAGGEPGLALLRESEATLASSPARLEHAWAQAELGAAMRRAGQRREARELLAQALDAARRCGALRLARLAREELRAAGARPRRDELRGRDALTASELRVARLAREGKTNAEIAQALFVTLKTVETHLTHAYQKLDISGRRELAAALPVDQSIPA